MVMVSGSKGCEAVNAVVTPCVPFSAGDKWAGTADFSYLREQILYYIIFLCESVTYSFTCMYREVFLNIYFNG